MPDSLTAEQKEEIDDKALTTIQLYLSDEILREILDEKITAGLRLKLESLYMTKSLTNKLYLKQHLFMLRMTEVMKAKLSDMYMFYRVPLSRPGLLVFPGTPTNPPYTKKFFLYTKR
uniref:Uncharacterized protein n=1 Tax=Ananas comosus var. bracteatus TaxID=296719 RepID=A0A6V7PXE9_ANACO|nr:unnamed protein product [Ananas comosus var. bracteatus]